MKFVTTLTPDKAGGFVVTFPDIPEAITQGENEAEALEHAQEALETALEFYFDDGRVVPQPTKPKPGEYFVELNVSLSAKVLAHKEMAGQNISAASSDRTAS